MIRRMLCLLVLTAPSLLRAQNSVPALCDTTLAPAALRHCASEELDAAKRDLNRYVQEARRVATNRALLDSAQGAWEHFRDVACRAAEDQYRGGTAKPVVVLRCLRDLTRRRVHEVYEHYLRAGKSALAEPAP